MIEVTEYRLMWVAVLLQALKDCQLQEGWRGECFAYWAHWLNSKDFSTVCSNAGMDEDFVKARFFKIAKNLKRAKRTGYLVKAYA